MEEYGFSVWLYRIGHRDPDAQWPREVAREDAIQAASSISKSLPELCVYLQYDCIDNWNVRLFSP